MSLLNTMKKLSLFLIAILCSLSISAQELFYTSFQTEEDFQQWTVIDNNADATTWKFDPYGDPSYVFYNYHSSNPADDWFISPAITPTETGTLAINFTSKGSSYGEKIELFYGNEPTLESMTNRITDIIDLNDEISSHLYLINGNANEPIYLGFHACSDADKWRLYLCDVKVQFTANPVDIQVADFISPASNFNLSQETVTVKVKNSGNVDVESFDISFSVDEETIATETVSQTLVVGAEMVYTFTAKADLSTPRKSYAIKAWTTHADDVNTTNDACSTEVLHKAPATIPYTMGFEANEYTDGISFFNLNEDDGDWSLYTDPWWSLAHTGDYCLAYNYDRNNNGDDWAILEPITIEEAGYYVLKFWYSSDDTHPEKLAVYYGNEGTPNAMTNKIVEYAPFARSTYEESINIFNIEEPQTIYIGFYAFSDKDENWLCVDDVTFEKVDADDVDVAALPITNPIEYVHNGTNKNISFKVRNLGIQDVASTISVEIDEETIYEGTVNILAQEIKDITIIDALKDVASGIHNITVIATTEGDVNETNDTQTLSFRVMDTPVFAWDFEDGQLPADFSYRVDDEGTINPDAGDEFNEYGWGIFNIQDHELYGSHVLAGTTWLDGTEKADRWLILPPFTPTEEAFLVWDVASFNPYYLESYAVMIHTNGDDPWYYFTEEEYIAESADFKTRGISLSEYSGQDIYIAFRLRSKNCEHLILDNIEVFGGTAVELFDVVATVNPEEGNVEKLDTFTVTFENVESVAIEEYSFYPPYIASIDEEGNMTEIASAKFETIEGQPKQISVSINDEEITEITEEGKYALVIPRKDLIFNDDSKFLTVDKEFVFNYEIKAEADKILPPTNVKAVAISDTEVELSWDPVEGALYYGIYINGLWLGAVLETSGVVDQLYPEVEYCFYIISISEVDENNNIVGYSDWSEPACATTLGTGVDEYSTSFNIYPNPANDVLFIENGNNIEKVTIYNMTGVMIYSEECTSNKVQVDVADLESGVYIVKIKTEDNEVINRFVKK